MSDSDLWLRDVTTSYGQIILVLFLIIFIIIRKWRKLCETHYKNHIVGFELEWAELAYPYKKELFKILRRIVSDDEILRLLGCIRVLEIGVKTGNNIQFYPDGTHFIGVDWNLRLADHLLDSNNSWEFGHIVLERLIVGDGSSLKEIPSGCVDVVVTTRSLCCTKSPRSAFKEIRRVLAPNGRYIFMEHVPETKSCLIRWLQTFLTRTGVWPSLYGDCRLNFDFIKEIKTADFNHVTSRTIAFDGPVSQPFHLTLTGRHVLGVAIK